MSTAWPESLKNWVTTCLKQMTEGNKDDAQAELKEVIRKSVNDGTMWTKDWSKERLTSLEPKTFKRKLVDDTSTSTPSTTKKPKKSPLSGKLQKDSPDLLAMRARRFEREHELERQKQAGLVKPSYTYNRHVNQQSPTLEDRMDGLTSTYSASSSRRAGADASRRKYLNSGVGYTDEGPSNNPEWGHIVGMSSDLFKNYFRLTSEPDPSTIRPLPILMKTLAEIKKRWMKEQNYPWTCDQLKSIRQDLTVQHIKNEFTVQVYEIHARMALEAADLVEYNQCQSTLRHLYEAGIPGKSEEFLAYRILYLVHVRNRSDLNRLISTLTPQVKELGPVKHALQVQRAMASSNYRSLFSLFNTAPNMGAYIMDHFVERERLNALCIMSKAYLTIPLAFVAKELAFEKVSELQHFLTTHGAAFLTPAKTPTTPISERSLDCKTAHPILLRVYEDKTRRIAIQGSI